MFAISDIPNSRIPVIYVLRPCAVQFVLCNDHDIFLEYDRWGCLIFLLPAIVSKDSTKLFSNKGDAFYSNCCFIDIVSFIEDACYVEFQGTYFLPGKLYRTREVVRDP